MNIVVAHGCRKTKKLICGTEGEIVVAHGRLPPLLGEHRLTAETFTREGARKVKYALLLVLSPSKISLLSV